MPPLLYPYTVTNSYKGGLFMKTYNRNVRRAWDGDEYRPPKRIRVDEQSSVSKQQQAPNKENSTLMVYDLEDNLERAIRETSVVALSSSPSRKNSTIFSLESHEDDGSNTITPPSSPPPPSQLQLTPPNVKPRKSTFACFDKQRKEKQKSQTQPLKRKHDALVEPARRENSVPLAEIHNSSRAHSMAPSASFTSVNRAMQDAAPVAESIAAPIPIPEPPKALVQSVLDFGQSLQPITCAACSMTYTPTVPSDTQLHDMYHNRHSSGIELGKPFLKSAMKWCYEVSHIPGSVVVVDRKLSVPARKVVVKVLEVVNKELGSVDISEDELWSQRVVPGDGEDAEGRKCDRYKVFLHVIDGKCVGVCLAERIGRAYKALPSREEKSKADVNGAESGKEDVLKAKDEQPPTPTSTSHEHPSLTLSKETYPAVVGVSRIWTSRTFRRKGIANNLLECVMNQFIYGMEIERTEVAFSQPTEMGTALAKAWFGSKSGNGDGRNSPESAQKKRDTDTETWGWRVYVEE